MRFPVILSICIALVASACNLSSSPASQTSLTSVPTATTLSQPTRTPITSADNSDNEAGSPSSIDTANTDTTTVNVSNNSNTSDNTTTVSSAGSTGNITSNSGTVICNKQTDWNTYTIVAGDTLFDIARRANTSVDALVSANCLVDAGLISVGQTLYVPSPVKPRVSDDNDFKPDNPQVDPDRYTLELWWIIQGDNGVTGFPTGCGDSIYLQQSGISINQPLDQLISQAFTHLTDDNNIGAGQGDRGFWNPMSTTSLNVDNYSIEGLDGSHLTAHLSGQLSLSGVCLDAQLEAQIAINLMSLTRTKTATILINDQNMRDIFDASGTNTETTYTWEEFQYGGAGNADNSGRELIEYWAGSETNAVAGAVEVGCGSYVVPINTGTYVTNNLEADVKTALTALFDPNRHNPSTVFTNLLKDQNLSVESVSINNGNATINISGTLMGVGTCGDPILEGQIIQTIFQFDEIQSAKVMNGERNLKQLVDQSGNPAVIDHVYTRSS